MDFTTVILLAIVAIAGAIAIIKNLRVRNARLHRRAPQPGTAGTTTISAWWPDHSSVWKSHTFWTIVALLLLEYVLWQHTPLGDTMFSGWALLHIPFYIIAIVTLSKLQETAGKFWSWGTVALLIALTIIGSSHIIKRDAYGNLQVVFGSSTFASSGSKEPALTKAEELIDQGCDGKAKTVRLTKKPTRVPPNCNWALGLEGAITLFDAKHTRLSMRPGDEGKYNHFPAVWWQAQEAETLVNVVFCDRNKVWNGRICA